MKEKRVLEEKKSFEIINIDEYIRKIQLIKRIVKITKKRFLIKGYCSFKKKMLSLLKVKKDKSMKTLIRAKPFQ